MPYNTADEMGVLNDAYYETVVSIAWQIKQFNTCAVKVFKEKNINNIKQLD